MFIISLINYSTAKLPEYKPGSIIEIPQHWFKFNLLPFPFQISNHLCSFHHPRFLFLNSFLYPDMSPLCNSKLEEIIHEIITTLHRSPTIPVPFTLPHILREISYNMPWNLKQIKKKMKIKNILYIRQTLVNLVPVLF